MSEVFGVYSNLSCQTQIRLNKINKIKDYLNTEICEREAMNKRRYFAAFNYFDNALIVLYATRGGISIGSFTHVIDTAVGIGNSIFSFALSVTTEIIKKLLKTTRNKNNKWIKIDIIVRNKLNSTEKMISEALVDSESSQEE